MSLLENDEDLTLWTSSSSLYLIGKGIRITFSFAMTNIK